MCATVPSQNSTSLTYTAGQVRHLVAYTISQRPRLLNPLMLFLLFRPKYVQPFLRLVLLEIQYWMPRRDSPCTNNG